MAMVYKFGLMDHVMKVIGKMTRQMVRESLFMQMEIFMKVSGLMTKLTEEVPMLMLMGLITKETGLKTNKKVMEWNHGLMGLSMRDSI
jgi:hypothetical protein